MQELRGQATEEQITDWKKQYGKVYRYEVEDKVCYLRPVDRTTYAVAAAKVSTSPAKFNETIIEKIWLGGDDDIKKVDEYYFGLTEFVDEMMNKKKGSLGEC